MTAEVFFDLGGTACLAWLTGTLLYWIPVFAWSCFEKPFGNPFRPKFRVRYRDKAYYVEVRTSFLDFWRTVRYNGKHGIYSLAYFDSLTEAQELLSICQKSRTERVQLVTISEKTKIIL